MGQEIPFEKCIFDLNYLVGIELFKSTNTYSPIIISVNYIKNGKPYAFINYGVFLKNSKGDIEGIKIKKQLVLVSRKYCLKFLLL
jgi:hypothetical protein